MNAPSGLVTRSRWKAHLHGFTLMEILIALVIVGIVTAIAIPSYQNYVTRARIAEALEFADAARVQVIERRLASGQVPASFSLLSKPVDAMTGLQWVPVPQASPTDDSVVGYLLPSMDLPGLGQRDVFALELLNNGHWRCTGASGASGRSAVSANAVLELNYLPSSCRDGAALLAAHPAAARGCPAGTQKGQVTDVNGVMHESCVPVAGSPAPAAPAPAAPAPAAPAPAAPAPAAPAPAAPAPAAPAPAAPAPAAPAPAAPVAAPAPLSCPSDKEAVAGACVDKCEVYQDRNPTTHACEARRASTNVKPTLQNNPCGPGAVWFPDELTVVDPKAALETFRPVVWDGTTKSGHCEALSSSDEKQGRDPYEDIQCHVCRGPIQICEQVHFPTTCTWPNNFCATLVQNHLNGTRTVTRGCANHTFAARNWYLGTSDDDKCDVMKNNQHVDFTCSFACTQPNCNAGAGFGLRPQEGSFYIPIDP